MNVSPSRVLVVEDSATMRAFVGAALESQGFEVVTAKNGFAALKLLPTERFTAIVADINMPDINGLELARFIRESPEQRQTPLILISTDGSPRDRERGLKLGAAEYLVKPFSPEELIAAVLRCTGRTR